MTIWNGSQSSPSFQTVAFAVPLPFSAVEFPRVPFPKVTLPLLMVELVVDPLENAVEFMVRVRTRLEVYEEAPDEVGATRDVMVVVMVLRVEFAGVAEAEAEAEADELLDAEDDWAIARGNEKRENRGKSRMMSVVERSQSCLLILVNNRWRYR